MAKLAVDFCRAVLVFERRDLSEDYYATYVKRPLVLASIASVIDAEARFAISTDGVDLVAFFATMEIYATGKLVVPEIHWDAIRIAVIAMDA